MTQHRVRDEWCECGHFKTAHEYRGLAAHHGRCIACSCNRFRFYGYYNQHRRSTWPEAARR